MDIFNTLFPEDLYHSYIVEGNPKTISHALYEFLKERGEISSTNPDVFMKVYDSFTISDGRKVKEWHSKLNTGDGKKIGIIGANFINHDAERTLLKIIEEPSLNTHFFIIVPNSLVLLDTIRSRAHIVSTLNESDNKIKEQAREFISMNSKQRIDMVAKIIKKYKDSQDSSNLRFEAIKLINEIEKNIFEKFQSNRNDKDIQFILNEFQEKREYLNLPGASVKMILEEIALVL